MLLPASSGRRAPPTQGVFDQRLEIHFLSIQEIGVLCCGQEKETFGDPGQPVQLVENHLSVVAGLVVRVRCADQLGMTPSDRDRRPELVGRVTDELTLPLEELVFVLGSPAVSYTHLTLPTIYSV